MTSGVIQLYHSARFSFYLVWWTGGPAPWTRLCVVFYFKSCILDLWCHFLFCVAPPCRHYDDLNQRRFTVHTYIYVLIVKLTQNPIQYVAQNHLVKLHKIWKQFCICSITDFHYRLLFLTRLYWPLKLHCVTISLVFFLTGTRRFCTSSAVLLRMPLSLILRPVSLGRRECLVHSNQILHCHSKKLLFWLLMVLGNTTAL